MLPFGLFQSVQTKDDRSKSVRRRQMRPALFPSQHLPLYVDLRPYMTPVEDQGQLKTCTANAFAGVCEYILKRRIGRNIDVSRLFIYYNGRLIQGRSYVVTDDGTSKRAIVLGLRKFGVCLEDIWPYYPRHINTTPPPDVYAAAKEITVIPLKVPRNLVAMKTCLANEIPFIIGIRLTPDAFDQAKENSGYIEMPNPNDPYVRKIGLHSVVVVGYNDRTQHFIARNSWGSNWGLDGYFYIPYQYLLERNLVNTQDGVWAITDIIIRTGYLPSVRQMIVPGHSRDERYRQMIVPGHSRDERYRQMIVPGHSRDERYRQMIVPGHSRDERYRQMMLQSHGHGKQHQRMMFPGHHHNRSHR